MIEDGLITELTPEEFYAAIRRELDKLGMTAAQFIERARADLLDAHGHALWMAVGGTFRAEQVDMLAPEGW